MVTPHLPSKFHAKWSSHLLAMLTNADKEISIAASRGFTELTQNWIRSSRGHSALSLKIACKSVQPFLVILLTKKERNKDTYKQRNRLKTIPRPPIYRIRGKMEVPHEISYKLPRVQVHAWDKDQECETQTVDSEIKIEVWSGVFNLLKLDVISKETSIFGFKTKTMVFVGVMLQYGALQTNYPDPDPGVTKHRTVHTGSKYKSFYSFCLDHSWVSYIRRCVWVPWCSSLAVSSLCLSCQRSVRRCKAGYRVPWHRAGGGREWNG